jgi:hypothetical protein
MKAPAGPEAGLDLASSSGVPTGSPLAMLWQLLLYALAAALATVWPYFMLMKVLPSLVYASGSPRLQGAMDSAGAWVLGAVCSLALGDFVARRSSGRRAFLTASLLFGGVFVLSQLSGGWPLSSGPPYGLVWPPHLLLVLAAVALSRRQGVRRFADFLGLLCWLMAGALALGFVGWLAWRHWEGLASPAALWGSCLGVGLVAGVRAALIIRGLRAERAPR